MKQVFAPCFLFALFSVVALAASDALLKTTNKQPLESSASLVSVLCFLFLSFFFLAFAGGLLGLLMIASLRAVRPSPLQKTIICASLTAAFVLFAEFIFTGFSNKHFSGLDVWLSALVIGAYFASHRLLRYNHTGKKTDL